jgi:hypothetical protein
LASHTNGRTQIEGVRVLRTFGPERVEGAGEDCIIRSFVRFSKYYFGDKIKEDEMGGACRPDGRDKCIHKILVGKPDAKRPLRRQAWMGR